MVQQNQYRFGSSPFMRTVEQLDSKHQGVDGTLLEFCNIPLGSRHWSLVPAARERLVEPHQELRVLLENLVGNLAGNGDDRGVVPLLPRPLEAGADSLEAKNLQLLLSGAPVLIEFPEQCAVTQFLEVAGPARIRDAPAVLRLRAESGLVLLKAAQLLPWCTTPLRAESLP